MSNLDHFRTGLERAVTRSKLKKVTQHVQHSALIENNSDNLTPTKSNTSTFALSDEQYRTSLIAKAIAHIKQKGVI